MGVEDRLKQNIHALLECVNEYKEGLVFTNRKNLLDTLENIILGKSPVTKGDEADDPKYQQFVECLLILRSNIDKLSPKKDGWLAISRFNVQIINLTRLLIKQSLDDKILHVIDQIKLSHKNDKWVSKEQAIKDEIEENNKNTNWYYQEIEKSANKLIASISSNESISSTSVSSTGTIASTDNSFSHTMNSTEKMRKKKKIDLCQ